MHQLKRIVDSTSCLIVISSTWRETAVSLRAVTRQLQVHWQQSPQARAFAPPLTPLLQQAGISASRVVGTTPVLGARAAEIVSWLQKERGSASGVSYCVLDDWDVGGSGFDVSRLVQCDSAQGLTEERADAAIALLMGRC
jgi:hypothetical protein